MSEPHSQEAATPAEASPPATASAPSTEVVVSVRFDAGTPPGPDAAAEVDVTVEAELLDEDATKDIAEAVSARHTVARRYVMWLRRRNPDATPAEVVRMLERQYGRSISTAGAVIAAGAIAADVGIAMIPGVGPLAAGAKSASQQGAKKAAKGAVKGAAKAAAKQAAKDMALTGAKGGAQRIAAFLPAGDQQMQFEITAVFGLAIADIHGMDLDKDQAMALVYGLTNDRVSQQQIATMAADVATVTSGGAVGVGQDIAAGRADWSHWATTLADTLPAGSAQSLVRTMQTGQLDAVREGLSGGHQAAVEYGVGAVTAGVARFAFGREVIQAARAAFPAPPDTFPSHLDLQVKAFDGGDDEDEPNQALASLKDAARSTGAWIGDTAGAVGGGVTTGAVAVGTGVATAAGTVSRPFRSVDLDGDGIPDEAAALTAVKGLGGSISGAADAVGGRVTGLFKSRKRDQPPT